MRKFIPVLGCAILFQVASAFAADDLSVAANAVNSLGVDLLGRVAKPDENALISPYSIQSALAMTYAGAAGETKAEMARVLHFPDDEAALHRSFAAFRIQLETIHERTVEIVKESAERGGPSSPVTLEIANRLYGQSGYAFRPAFLSEVKDNYGAPFQPVDFQHAAERVRGEINRWVSERTYDRINDLIPSGGVNEMTRLALVNAIYFKASWEAGFEESATKEEPFFVGGDKPGKVQMMLGEGYYGYLRGDGFCGITISYVGGDMQLLVLLPDEKDGLAALESRVTPKFLAKLTNQKPTKLILHLPKFKLEPPTIPLGSILRSLGMKTAFDQPSGSADFDRMAPRKLDNYLYLSTVFHRSFLALDEKGTEAAAASAVEEAVFLGVSGKHSNPIEVKVDHPFIFAIQHRASGACLFLGRVVDPR